MAKNPCKPRPYRLTRFFRVKADFSLVKELSTVQTASGKLSLAKDSGLLLLTELVLALVLELKLKAFCEVFAPVCLILVAFARRVRGLVGYFTKLAKYDGEGRGEDGGEGSPHVAVYVVGVGWKSG